jgi:hypothetical protein
MVALPAGRIKRILNRNLVGLVFRLMVAPGRAGLGDVFMWKVITPQIGVCRFQLSGTMVYVESRPRLIALRRIMCV